MSAEHSQGRSCHDRSSALPNTGCRDSETEVIHQDADQTWHQTLFESVPSILFTLCSSGRILAVSQFAVERLGYSAVDSLLGQSVLTLFYAAERVRLQALLTAAEQISQRADGELRLLHRDGTWLWVRLTTRAVGKAEADSVILLVCEPVPDYPKGGTASHRQQIEQALREREHQMRLIANAVSGKLCYVDAQQRYRFVNKRFEEWYGLSCETIIGMRIPDLPGNGIYPRIQPYIEAVLAGENLTFEFTGTFPDGKERCLRVNYVPDIRAPGEVVGFVVVCEDLTECRQLEEALRQFNLALESQVHERTAQLKQALEFEATLKRITDKVRDSLDEAHVLQTAVQTLGRAVGVRSCKAALHDVEHGSATICYEYTLSPPSSQGSTVQMANAPEIYQQLRSGQYFQFCAATDAPNDRAAILTCPILDGQDVLGDLRLTTSSHYVFSEQDIRLVQQAANQCAIGLRQSRLYQLAQAQVQELERLNQLKDDFLSTVSHELRTPLTNLRVALRMMKLAPSQDKQQQYFDLAVRECEREIELINDLLDLQRLEANSYQLNPEPIDLKRLLPELVNAIQPQTQAQGQQLYLNIPANLNCIRSDRSLLERIMRELLSNASKYTDQGGQILVEVIPTQSGVQLIVKNTAEISSTELLRLFDKFYRVPQADRWRRGGTGLGLSLIKQMVGQLQGTIQVISEDGWTIFTVWLPG